MVYWPSTHGILTPYPWNIDPLPMVYRTPTHGILTPYQWYIDLHTHGISMPLPMVYRPPYPSYIDSLNHGISTPLPMVYQPPNHGILTPYPWYIDFLPMEYRPPYPWYIEPLSMVYWLPLPMEYRPPTHRISTPYPWYFDHPVYLLIRNEGGQNTMGVQFTIQGELLFNKGGQYTMDENRPWSQFTMGVKIPYDTVTELWTIDFVKWFISDVLKVEWQSYRAFWTVKVNT